MRLFVSKPDEDGPSEKRTTSKVLNTLSRQKKRIFIYNTAHHPTDITRCERESVCAYVEEGGGGGRRRGIARS